MRDGASGRSRGFGFLTFKDPRTVNVVMVKEHYLDGKIVRPEIPIYIKLLLDFRVIELKAHILYHLRLTLKGQFLEMNRNEPARFLLEV